MSEDAIDLKYARQVSDYIGSDHTEVYMTPQEVLASLETVIYWEHTTSQQFVPLWECIWCVKQSMNTRISESF